MKTKKTLLFICLLLFVSCIGENGQVQESSNYILEQLPDKCFELDENTVQTTPYMQYIAEQDLFCFTNEYDNSITINDFTTGKTKKKIYFDKEGSNGVGSISSFYIQDSLVYLHHHWNNKVYITDTCGILIKSIPLLLQEHAVAKGIYAPAILPHTYSPIKLVDNKLLLSGYQADKMQEAGKDCPSAILYDLTTGNIDFVNNYPPIYQKGFWGHNMRLTYYTINPNKEIVVSFPADVFIYVIDPDKKNETKRYYAGITDPKKQISPVVQDKTRSVPFDLQMEHYMKNIIYGAIYYDDVEQIYYRIVLLPTKMNADNNDEKYNKRLQLIALDSDFQIIGKYDLPEDFYWSGCAFLSKEGLHIQTKSDNDDIMRFKTFKIRRK